MMTDPHGDEFDRSIDRDPETGTYRTRCTWTGERPPSIAVVDLLAQATASDPGGIEPLWNYVDPDALDDLFAPTGDRQPRPDGRVSFRYAEFEVTVEGDGVTLTPIDGSE